MRLKIFFLSLLMLAVSAGAEAQKIFLTGDSHVSAKVYPQKVGEILRQTIPGAKYSFWGKAAAGFYTFNEKKAFMDSIFNNRPDILVVHLGTNGSYSVFEPEKFSNDLRIFHEKVRSQLPDCKIVYVTPFLNNRQDKTTKKWDVNRKTRQCADLIIDFAAGQPDTFVIDNNADAGEVFLSTPGLIRDDGVHLTAKGYNLLGEQVAARLIELIEADPE